MRKIIALLMVIAMMIPLATVASAAESTTILTMEVPAATYTLSIPQNQTVTFGMPITAIGGIAVTNAEGFSLYKDVSVTISYDEFTSETTSSTIPFDVGINFEFSWKSGESIIFEGQQDGSVNTYPTAGGNVLDSNEVTLEFSSDSWAKAMAGTYTATMTFTSEVVPAS